MIRWKDIQQSFRFPSEGVVFELCYTPGELLYHTVHLKRIKDRVEVVQTGSDTDFDRIQAAYDAKLPVFLLLTGKKILTKEVRDIKEDTSEEVIMNRAFPNVDLRELVYSIEYVEDRAMVSIVRQDFITGILSRFTEAGKKVIDLAIGVYTLSPILSQLASGTYHFGNFQMDTSKRTIRLVQENRKEKVDVLGETLEASFAVPFLFGLARMAAQDYTSTQPEVTYQRKDWQYFQGYKKGLFGGMAAIFVVLLLSFLLFTYYHDANQTLAQATQSYDVQFQRVADLKASYEEKSRFLEVNGSGSGSFSKMADQLAASVPKGVTLQQMNFYPLEKRLKKEKLVRFSREVLLLKGATDNYDYFQSWLDEIHRMPWIEDVQIAGYQEENEKHRAQFNLKVVLRNE